MSARQADRLVVAGAVADDPLVVGWRYAHQRLDEVSHVDRIDRDGIVRGHLRLAEQITGHPITKAVR